MNCFLFLMCCIAIVGVQLSEAEDGGSHNANSTISSSSQSNSSAAPNSSITSITEASRTTKPTVPITTSTAVQSTPRDPVTVPKPSPPDSLFFKKECLQVFVASGGLIILCFILLLSTFMLALKVCRLNRHIKELSSNADLISASEYWMDTAKKNKSKSEKEPEETTVLMSDLSQTKEERANGTTKEEGEKVDKDKHTEEENKTEEGDATKSEEAATTAVTVCESSPSSEPKKEAIEATAAPSPESTEEAKHVV